MQDDSLNPTPQLPPQPQLPPLPPKHSNKNLIILIVSIILAIIVVAVGLVLIFTNNSKSATKSVKATHSKIYQADIAFGQNRAVNACNVLPLSLVTTQFGTQSDLNENVVTESVIESNVPESSIDPNEGNDEVTSCLRSLDGGGSIHLSFDGYRSLETAQAGYKKDIAYDRKAKGNTVTEVTGLDAATITYVDHKVTLEGAHDNYVYKLEVESGVVEGALSNNELEPKTIALAKQIVVNMDDSKTSTHPAVVPTTSTTGGPNQIDPCQLFDAKTFETSMLAHSASLAKKGFPKTAYQANVNRLYNLSGTASIGDVCSRQSAPKPYANTTLAEALKDAFTSGSENVNVTLDGFTTSADAQHNVDVLSDSAAEPLSGIGDKASFGQGGLEANIKQLAFSKGNYSAEITANYGIDTSTDFVPEADFISLAKALAAKLP